VLMSPLLKFAQPDLSEGAFARMAAENSALSLVSPSKLAEEFSSVSMHYPTETLISSVADSTEILILQSRNDDITPGSVALEHLPLFKTRPAFEWVDTDHSFVLGREKILHRVGTFLC
jgi:hypothetical protein